MDNLELKEFKAHQYFENIQPFTFDEPYYKMTLQEWHMAKKLGIITNNDGYGYYGTENDISKIDAFSVLAAPDNMNYVYWYNK